MRDLETALKAAADPTRTRILKLLEPGELCVCQIQAVLGLATSTVSKHLSILRQADLVDDRRDGKWIHYGLARGDRNPHAAAVLDLVRSALKRDPAIAQDRRKLAAIRRIPVATLCSIDPAERSSHV